MFCLQVVGVTALACGMIAVGSCNGDVTSTIVQTIMEKNEQELKDSYARWLPLGLGLNHLGKQWQLNNHCNMQVFCTVMCGKLSLEMNYISTASVLLFCSFCSSFS